MARTATNRSQTASSRHRLTEVRTADDSKSLDKSSRDEVIVAIERTIANCREEDDRIDEAMVASVLRTMIVDDSPTTLPQAWLFVELVAIRDQLAHLTRSHWIGCLLGVLENTSPAQPRMAI